MLVSFFKYIFLKVLLFLILNIKIRNFFELMDFNFGVFFFDSSNMYFIRFIIGVLTKNFFNKKSLGFSRIVEGLVVFFFIISFALLEVSRKIIKFFLFFGEFRD